MAATSSLVQVSPHLHTKHQMTLIMLHCICSTCYTCTTRLAAQSRAEGLAVRAVAMCFHWG